MLEEVESCESLALSTLSSLAVDYGIRAERERETSERVADRKVGLALPPTDKHPAATFLLDFNVGDVPSILLYLLYLASLNFKYVQEVSRVLPKVFILFYLF